MFFLTDIFFVIKCIEAPVERDKMYANALPLPSDLQKIRGLSKSFMEEESLTVLCREVSYGHLASVRKLESRKNVVG